MTAFSTSNVKAGPGTIYAAPLTTTEPTAVSGAWPAGWVKLGYTDGGSTFSHAPATGTIDVEEEYYPIRYVTTGAADSFAWAFAEDTARNFLIALNAGVGTPGAGTGLAAGTTGTNGDGSIWVEPPALGAEVRIMLGWDAINTDAGAGGSDPFGRLILRQCYQTGTVTENHQKGTNKKVIAVTFNLEKPTGAQPYRKIYPAALAS